MTTAKYRVTMTTSRGKRLATSITWDNKKEAQQHADDVNRFNLHPNARVVKDSERVRRMIP